MTLDKVVDKAVLKLKADMHLHTNADPLHREMIKYDAFQLIDHLFAKGFHVFSITLHDVMQSQEEMQEIQAYAKERGIIYYPGIERTIEKHHILIYNMRKEDAESIDTFPELYNMMVRYGVRSLKERDNVLLVPSHPEFPSEKAIGEALDRWHDLFHGLEYSSVYIPWINFNKKGLLKARMYHLFMVGFSDGHDLEQIGNTYTEIRVPSDVLEFGIRPRKFLDSTDFRDIVRYSSPEDYERIKSGVMHYIKIGDVSVKTRPLSFFYLLKLVPKILFEK